MCEFPNFTRYKLDYTLFNAWKFYWVKHCVKKSLRIMLAFVIKKLLKIGDYTLLYIQTRLPIIHTDKPAKR